ncbi:MAG: hypothetical protein WD266_01355 [Balneolales bacterium]
MMLFILTLAFIVITAVLAWILVVAHGSSAFLVLGLMLTAYLVFEETLLLVSLLLLQKR